MNSLKQLYTKLKHKKDFIRGLSYISLGNVVTSVGGFLAVIILANLLAPHEYGNYKYVFSVVGILTALSFTNSYKNIAIQATAKGFDGVILYLFRRNVLLSLPMLLGGISVGIYYLLRNNDFLGSAIMVATLCSIIGNNGVIAYGYLNGRKLYRLMFFMQILQSAVNVFTLLLVTSLTKNLLLVITANVTATAILLTSFFFVVCFRILRNTDMEPKFLNYGTHLNILGVVSVILINIDSILIFKLLGSHSLALYALSTPFVDRLISFFKGAYYFVLPKFVERGQERAYYGLYRRSLLMVGIGILVFVAYYISAPFIFKLFFPAYIESIALSRLFALNIPLIAATVLADAFLDSIMEVHGKYILKAVISTVRISTMLIFIIPFGVVGVIYSELVARLVGLCLTFYLTHRNIKKLLK